MATEIYLGYPPENIKKWIEENYKPKPDYPMMNVPLTFEADEASDSYSGAITLITDEASEGDDEYVDINQLNLEISKNNGPYIKYTVGETITLGANETVSFRATEEGNETINKYINGEYRFIVKGHGLVKVYGNIMSLLKQDMNIDVVPDHCFEGLFAVTDDDGGSSLFDCEDLILPASTVGKSGYRAMFHHAQIGAAPKYILATSMDIECCHSMFSGCDQMASPPVALLTENLTHSCYHSMFKNCRRMITMPDLKFNTISSYATCTRMFQNCGLLVDLSKFTLSAKTSYPAELDIGCYQSMFDNCKGLKKSPHILLENVTGDNYYGTIHQMFGACTNIEDVYFPNLTKQDIINQRLFKTTASMDMSQFSGIVHCKDGNIEINTLEA